VQPVKPHPITEGVEMFCESDEHYRLKVLSPDVDVLIASHSAAQGEESKYQEDPYHNTTAYISAAGVVRTQGKGRVCVLTPGHKAEVWKNPQFQKTLENALNWCNHK
jgi:type 1 glutamine amidotransferase